MLILSLFLGLIFGFTGYHFFVAPYVLRQGLRHGLLGAAAQLKDWLESLTPEFREQVETSMATYNLDQALRRALRALGKDYKANDVAPESGAEK